MKLTSRFSLNNMPFARIIDKDFKLITRLIQKLSRKDMKYKFMSNTPNIGYFYKHSLGFY